MSCLIIPIHSRTASFRDPEFQNFHRSLPLPPPATCIGLAGAALGLSPAQAQDYFREGEWRIGIAGDSGGMATDLWKYDDFKAGSILIREILFDNLFLIVFQHELEEKVRELRNAFIRPHYALSCGPSDSICTVDVHAMRIIDATTNDTELVHCYADGDIVADTLSTVAEGGSAAFSIRTTSTPLAQDLPVRFDYDAKGIRMLRQRRLLSYVQYPARLPKPVSGVKYTLPDNNHERFIPLFPL